jgi:hypothetical protein
MSSNLDVVAAYQQGRPWALGQPVSLDEWTAVMRDGLLRRSDVACKLFDLDRVRDRLARFAGDITLQPAREYRIAVYIRGPRPHLTAIARMARRQLKANEVDFYERERAVDGRPGKIVPCLDVLRLWWN